jgi:hypothetical protein
VRQVRELINILVATSLAQFYEDGAVVPLNLRLGLLVIGCKDNLDLLARSTTAGSSFHGTTISLFQQPTEGKQSHVYESKINITEAFHTSQSILIFM